MPASTFSKELNVFQEHRQEWLRSNPGKFVAIQGSVVADGFFATYAEAFKAGLQRFGVRKGFLVKQVWTTEPVYFVSYVWRQLNLTGILSTRMTRARAST